MTDSDTRGPQRTTFYLCTMTEGEREHIPTMCCQRVRPGVYFEEIRHENVINMRRQLTGYLVKYSFLKRSWFCHNDKAAPGGNGNLKEDYTLEFCADCFESFNQQTWTFETKKTQSESSLSLGPDSSPAKSKSYGSCKSHCVVGQELQTHTMMNEVADDQTTVWDRLHGC